VVLLTTLFMACDPPKDIGLTPLTPVGTFYTDTLTVRTSTVLADSVRTSNPDVFLVGRYQDPIFGKITASSHFWMNANPTTVPIGSEARYDSLVLLMAYGYTYGDTLPTQKIAVHRLTQDLSRTTTYYNNSQVSYESTPLGETTFLPHPNNLGSMRIKLSDALGTELFTLLSNSANQTSDKIHGVLKGLALVPGANNTAIIGVPGGPQTIFLQMYFRSSATDTTAKAYTMYANLGTVGGGTYRAGFNRVTADRTGTPLEGLQPLRPRHASATNGYTYVQDALGIMTKIEIPYLSSIRKNGPAAINRAQLSIRPDQSFNRPGITHPSFLVMLETDSTNRIKRNAGNELIVNSDISGFSSFTIDPQIVPYNNTSRDYTFYLTTQLQAILSGTKKNNSFLLTPIYTQQLGLEGTRFESQLNNRVNRLVVGTKPEDVKLILFYTVARE
jgi:hypothetical protein